MAEDSRVRVKQERYFLCDSVVNKAGVRRIEEGFKDSRVLVKKRTE